MELVEKLPLDGSTKTRFIKDLKLSLYKRHKSFLSNPLLLSIMLMTYGTSAEIPDKISVFYGQAFDALYQRHDALKGAYKRRKLTGLDIHDFSRVVTGFAIATYAKRKTTFSRTEVLDYTRKAKKIMGLDCNDEAFLSDMLQSLCLLVEDGMVISFAHRSFQEYFAAKFIRESSQVRQVALIEKYLQRIGSDTVLNLLHEMDAELVDKKIILPLLDELANSIKLKRSIGITHYLRFIKFYFSAFSVDDSHDARVSAEVKGIEQYEKLRFIRSCYGSVDCMRQQSSDAAVSYEHLKLTHFDTNDLTSIRVSSLTTGSPFVKDLARTHGVWSIQALRNLFDLRDVLRDRWKSTERSIEEILSI